MGKSYYKFGSTKNPYGLKNNQLVFVDEVDNGLKCGCVCPTCRVNLIAKQGDIREHHFAHQNDDNSCLHIQETYFLRTKEILETNRCIMVPDYPSNQPIIYSIKEIQTKKISDDKGILPDIIVTTTEGRNITIRFKTKRDYNIYESEINKYLELDATDVKIDQLDDFLIKTHNNKKWINGFKNRRHRRTSFIQERNDDLDSFFDDTSTNIDNNDYSSNFEYNNNIKQIDLTALRNDNDYLNQGTKQQKRIKSLLRHNEYFGQTKSKCSNCVNANNNKCPFLIEQFIENNTEYIICSNNDRYMQKYHKDNYLNFNSLPNFDSLEQYEAKIWIGKHFTRNTIIDNFTRINNHIVILHTNNNIFYVTNVSVQNKTFHFSHEKEYKTYKDAEEYYKWVKEL